MSADFDRAPIARIVVMAGTQVVSRGTGTLVAPKLVLSALHVVANRKTDPPQPYPGELRLEFQDFATTGTILQGAWDRVGDWVLIECAESPPVVPMPLATLHENKREWESFGFPDANARDGLLLTGDVMMCEGKLEGTRAHQLFCTQAAAGGGGRVKGMSGAPVVINGSLVGVMRFALMEQDRAEMGTLYACPVNAVTDRWPALTAAPLAKTEIPRFTTQFRAMTAARAGWEMGALAGSLAVTAVVIFALSRVHVPSTLIDAEIRSGDVGFALSAPDAMLLNTSIGLLDVQSVDVNGLASVEMRNAAGTNRTTVETRTAHFALDSAAGSRSHLQFDFSRPLQPGSDVLIHRTADERRFRLTVDSLDAPLKLQFSGAITFATDAGAPVQLRNEIADSAMLVPKGAQSVSTAFDLGPRTTVTLAAPIRVRDLAFFDKYPGSGVGWTFEPTIVEGTIGLDAPKGDAVRLAAKDSLVIGADSVTVSQITFPNDSGGFSVRFAGRVTKLMVGSGGAARDLMPTWLERLRRSYPLQSGVVAVAMVSLMAYLMVRWRRRKS